MMIKTRDIIDSLRCCSDFDADDPRKACTDCPVNKIGETRPQACFAMLAEAADRIEEMEERIDIMTENDGGTDGSFDYS